MDGGSIGSPGTLVPATACVRVDATHLQRTLAQALVNVAADCLLFYPYGSNTPASRARTEYGRPGARQFSDTRLFDPDKPSVRGIKNNRGSAWNVNLAFAAAMAPITLSGSKASRTYRCIQEMYRNL